MLLDHLEIQRCSLRIWSRGDSAPQTVTQHNSTSWKLFSWFPGFIFRPACLADKNSDLLLSGASTGLVFEFLCVSDNSQNKQSSVRSERKQRDREKWRSPLHGTLGILPFSTKCSNNVELQLHCRPHRLQLFVFLIFFIFSCASEVSASTVAVTLGAGFWGRTWKLGNKKNYIF